jgi:hypothetical protein
VNEDRKEMRELLNASAVALGMAAMASACRDQVSAPPPSPAGSSYVTETVVTPSPTPTKPMPTGASAVLAAAPELTPESARMLVEISPGASVDVVVRTSLLEATHGFPYLSPNELRGLGALFARAYAHLTVDDRGRLESYLQRVRGGDPGATTDEAVARRLFNVAVDALSPDDRQRLQALYERAIAASLAAKRTAARAAAEPVPIRATPEPAVIPSSPPMMVALPPSAARVLPSHEASDAEPDALTEQGKRGRANMYRSQLAAAEADVERAEAGLKWAEDNWHFVNSHTNQSFSLEKARSRLEQAKKELEWTRKQRDDIEDAARREGIPPGWLR